MLMRENSDSLYNFIIKLLKEDGTSEYAKHAALRCAAEWIGDGHWFIAHNEAALFFLGLLN